MTTYAITAAGNFVLCTFSDGKVVQWPALQVTVQDRDNVYFNIGNAANLQYLDWTDATAPVAGNKAAFLAALIALIPASGTFYSTSCPQLKIGYDTSNTLQICVNSVGLATFAQTGTSRGMTFAVGPGQFLVDSSSGDAGAIRLNCNDVAGGIQIAAGTNGLTSSTTGALQQTSSDNQTLSVVADNASDKTLLLSSANSGAGNGLVAISSDVWDVTGAGAMSGLTQLTVDNLDLNGNTLTATSGDLIINTTHPSGALDLDAGTGGVTIDTTGGFDITGVQNSSINLAVNNGSDRTLTISAANTGAGNGLVAISSDVWDITGAGALTGLTQLAVDSIDVNGSTITTTSGDLTVTATGNVNFPSNLYSTANYMFFGGGNASVGEFYSPIHIKGNVNDSAGTLQNLGITFEGNNARCSGIYAQKVAGSSGYIVIANYVSGSEYDMFQFRHDAEMRITNTSGDTIAFLTNGIVPPGSFLRINSSDRGTTNYFDIQPSQANFVALDSKDGRIRVNDDLEVNGLAVHVPTTQTLSANGQTITPSRSVVWVTDNTGFTGTILNEGTYDGQICSIGAVGTGPVTWATDATSNVQDAVSNQVASGSIRRFVWYAAGSRWYGVA